MRIALSAFAVFVACTATGCDKTEAADSRASHQHTAECTCAKGKQGETTWCEKCKVGYIKGKKSKDRAAVAAALEQ
jgi:hypothetical protein